MGTYRVSHFKTTRQISRKLKEMEKIFVYKSCRVQRGPTDGSLNHALEVKDQGHLKVRSIF